MNKVEAIRRLNEEELAQGLAGTSASWHVTYRECPFVYVGGLPVAVTEGDLLTMFEQFGTVLMVDIVREENGKSRGFGFVEYEDARSAVLAVDNFCGVELGGRVLSVDHAHKYERRKGRGIDTAPPRESRAVREDLGDDVMVEKEVEERREREVMKRLKRMRKERGNESEEDRDDNTEKREGSEAQDEAQDEAQGRDRNRDKREEKKRRKREREERKAERARIREERKRRRAERESHYS